MKNLIYVTIYCGKLNQNRKIKIFLDLKTGKTIARLFVYNCMCVCPPLLYWTNKRCERRVKEFGFDLYFDDNTLAERVNKINPWRLNVK